MINNCNCAQRIDCGCIPEFDFWDDNLYSALSVGNLTGGSCTFEEYVIDWYRNGEHALVSGKGSNPEIQAYHPFTGSSAIPVEGGIWKPVLRYVVIASEKVWPNPHNCKKWCLELKSELPIITVRSIGCDIIYGSPASGYTFRIGYKTTQDFSFAARIIRWELPKDGSMKYLAMQFTTYLVPDLVEVFYNSESTPLLAYWVGQDLAGNRGDILPNMIDLQSVKMVANFSEREYSLGDYLSIRVTPSTNPNTEWVLDLKCLHNDSFSSDCQYFPLTLRDVEWSQTGINYDSVNCKYLITFPMQVMAAAFEGSNLNKYLTIQKIASSNDSILNATSGVATLTMWDKVFCTGEALHTHYHVNSAGLISYTKAGNTFTFIFEHADDYTAYKNWYNSNRANWKFSSYNPDPTHIDHYKIHQIAWQEATRCGDAYIHRQIYFHWLSPVTFDDAAKTMRIEFVDITNLYPNEQPRQKCDNTWEQINTWVSACQSTKNSADWSGSTRCREGRPINGIWIYQQVWNDLSKNFYWTYAFPVRSLENICGMSGWAEFPSFQWRWQFHRFNLLVDITDTSDRVGNFRISTQLNRETGENTGVWERVYEKKDGIQIYP